ncbi:MAG: hypothetical protein CL431_10740 [Acidimicrobiaceae bacterium]|nr:hypothetical protein [Acidimicrobiaceae bacterium]|tara:strand:+ start:1465 stop:2061 length:597 start_codon:yes stop_codon:yes gene_type:complete
MTFWTEASVEPKRKFRWLLYLSGMPQFIVKSVKKPAFKVGTTPHQFLNYEFHYPGSVKWDPVSMVIVDPVNPDSAASLYSILETAGYVVPTAYSESAPKTISKAEMVRALGNEIKIVQLNPEGNVAVETWTLKNPQIESVEFDQLDYNSDELLNITIGLKYDFATLETPATQAQWSTNTTSPGAGGTSAADNSGTITD